jgi:streptogramin lyase
MTTSGTVTNFSVGLNAGSSPRAIDVGPDGNLWFNDMGTTKAIGRITTA